MGLWLAAMVPAQAVEPARDPLGIELPEAPAGLSLRVGDEAVSAAPRADVAPPDLPAVPPVAEALGLPEPVRTGSVAELAVPPAPEVSVVVGTEDVLSGAVELKLAEGKGIWPQRLPKADREAIASFYAARQQRPIWIADNAWNGAARSLMRRLEIAAEDGLDPAEYPIPAIGPGAARQSAAELAEAELKLSAAAALFARDARGGRMNPGRLSSLLTP